MTSIVKEIVDLTVSREQFLCVFNRSKFLGFSFSSSDGDMRTFGAVVLVSSPHFMYQFDLEFLALAGAYSGTDAALCDCTV